MGVVTRMGLVTGMGRVTAYGINFESCYH